MKTAYGILVFLGNVSISTTICYPYVREEKLGCNVLSSKSWMTTFMKTRTWLRGSSAGERTPKICSSIQAD